MTVNLVKWGNSAAIRIPKMILDKLNVDSTNIGDVIFEIALKGINYC